MIESELEPRLLLNSYVGSSNLIITRSYQAFRSQRLWSPCLKFTPGYCTIVSFLERSWQNEGT